MFASDLRSLAALTADDVCAACNGTGSITGVRIEIRGSQRIHPPRCQECGGTGLAAISEENIPYGPIPDESEMEVTKR